jgi:hypothetical protein
VHVQVVRRRLSGDQVLEAADLEVRQLERGLGAGDSTLGVVTAAW